MILPNYCFDNCPFLKTRFYDDGGGHCDLYNRYITFWLSRYHKCFDCECAEAADEIHKKDEVNY